MSSFHASRIVRLRLALAPAAFVAPALLLAVLGPACSVTDAGSSGDMGSEGGGSGVPTTSGMGGGGADATVPDAQPDVTPPTYADLCGEGDCVPGAEDDGCFLGVGGSNEGGEREVELLGCRVEADDDGEPVSACAPAGAGPIDAPCQRSGDCRPGSACVPTEPSENQTSAGICRPYCCGSLELCAPGSFCAPRPLLDDADLDVPVCVAATPCELLEDGSCPPGTTCAVVRADGTTSCAKPGGGELCEPCPCAAGYVCSVHTGLCQKLCRTDGAEDECGGGLCQGGSSDYPAGIGVCVGGAEEACSDG